MSPADKISLYFPTIKILCVFLPKERSSAKKMLEGLQYEAKQVIVSHSKRSCLD